MRLAANPTRCLPNNLGCCVPASPTGLRPPMCLKSRAAYGSWCTTTAAQRRGSKCVDGCLQVALLIECTTHSSADCKQRMLCSMLALKQVFFHQLQQTRLLSSGTALQSRQRLLPHFSQATSNAKPYKAQLGSKSQAGKRRRRQRAAASQLNKSRGQHGKCIERSLTDRQGDSGS